MLPDIGNKTTDSTRRRQFVKTLGTGGIVLLGGCIGDGSSGGSNSSSSSGGNSTMDASSSGKQSTKLAVAHYPTIVDSTPIIVGKKKGIYAKHNVKIPKITSFSGGGTTVRGIVTGGIGMGITALPGLIQAYNKGAQIYLAGLNMSQSPINYLAKPNSNIKKIQDSKGKKIAVSTPGSSSEAMTIASIKAADGITLDDITIMHAGGLGEAITAMNQGNADISWGIPPKSTSMVDDGDARIVWWGRDYEPNLTEQVLAIGEKTKSNNPKLAKNLLIAHSECLKWSKNNVNEAASLWADTSGIDKKLAKKAYKQAKPEKIFQSISPNEEILKTTAKTMIDQGLIDKQPPWKKIIWKEALPKNKRANWV